MTDGNDRRERVLDVARAALHRDPDVDLRADRAQHLGDVTIVRLGFTAHARIAIADDVPEPAAARLVRAAYVQLANELRERLKVHVGRIGPTRVRDER